MQTVWLSAHLFYAGDLHVLLREMVIPFLKDRGCPAFFIRYGEGGLHIRLRCQLKVSDVTGVQVALLAMEKTFEGLTVRFTDYIPEINRYGDARSIGWAERQFVASSRYVLEVLSAVPEWSTSAALIQALRMNIAMAWALETAEEEITAICSLFIKGWLRRLFDPSKPAGEQDIYYTGLMEARFNSYANVLLPAAGTIWHALQNEIADSSLQVFAEENKHVFRQYRGLEFDTSKMRDIVGSCMHMGHNRLGVSNLDEAYIMFFTLKCLQYVYAGG